MRHVRRCLLPLLLLLFLAGCGGVSDLVGTYTLEHLDVGAGTVDMAELSDAAQAAGIDFQATLALEEDGTFSLEVTAPDGASVLSLTLYQNGEELHYLFLDSGTEEGNYVQGVVDGASGGWYLADPAAYGYLDGLVPALS